MRTSSGALPFRSGAVPFRSLPPGCGGGAAPLDRSTGPPQRAIPFWCATPMGQGDFEDRKVLEAHHVQDLLLGSFILDRRGNPTLPLRACLQASPVSRGFAPVSR